MQQPYLEFSASIFQRVDDKSLRYCSEFEGSSVIEKQKPIVIAIDAIDKAKFEELLIKQASYSFKVGANIISGEIEKHSKSNDNWGQAIISTFRTQDGSVLELFHCPEKQGIDKENSRINIASPFNISIKSIGRDGNEYANDIEIAMRDLPKFLSSYHEDKQQQQGFSR